MVECCGMLSSFRVVSKALRGIPHFKLPWLAARVAHNTQAIKIAHSAKATCVPIMRARASFVADTPCIQDDCSAALGLRMSRCMRHPCSFASVSIMT